MSKTLKQYLAEQDQAVLASFLDERWCICAAISRNALAELAATREATLEDLPGYAQTEAVVVRRKGFAELWVRARRSDYRAPFLAFASRHHGYHASSVPAGYNVDHLFSKNRVRTAKAEPDDERLPHATLVRMQLVDSSVNQSFGNLMESAMAGSGRSLRDVRRFDYLQLAKALSIDANVTGGGLSGPRQTANFAHVVDEFAQRGVLEGLCMSREAMTAELIRMAEKVSFFRA